MNSRRAALLWSSPAILLLVGLVAWPMARLIRLSLSERSGNALFDPGTWTLQSYRDLQGDSYFWELYSFTLMLGGLITLVCIILAWPVAYLIWQLGPRAKAVALAAVIVPKLSNLLVTIYGLKLILGDYGPINRLLKWVHLVDSPISLQNNLTGVVIGESLLILPYTILLLWAGLERIDRQLVIAARGLGASPWASFRHITLPLALPALGSATLISIIWGLGAFISPYLLGSPEELTLSVNVQKQMMENFNWPRGAAEGVALLLTLVAFAFLYRGGSAFTEKFTRKGEPS